MFSAACIPSQLLAADSQPASQHGSAAGPSFPFNLLFFQQLTPKQELPGSVGAATSGLVEAIRAGNSLSLASSARGGPAGFSGRQATRSNASSLVRLQFGEDAPHLVGRRSMHSRPRRSLPLSGAEPIYDDRDTRWFDLKETALHGGYSWAMQDYQEGREEPPAPGDVWRAELASDEELPAVLTCRDFVKQVLLDNKEAVQCVHADQPCPPGHYKVMAFADPEGAAADEDANFLDYTFYVQHKDVNVTLKQGDKLDDVARFFKLPVEAIYEANPELRQQPADKPLPRERSVFLPRVNVWSHKPSEWHEPRLYDGTGCAIHNPLTAAPTYSDDEGGVNELPSTYCCSFCVRAGQARSGP